ncbi:hypothetical protein AKJ16_DCAP24325 [Drosera capensis]
MCLLNRPENEGVSSRLSSSSWYQSTSRQPYLLCIYNSSANSSASASASSTGAINSSTPTAPSIPFDLVHSGPISSMTTFFSQGFISGAEFLSALPTYINSSSVTLFSLNAPMATSTVGAPLMSSSGPSLLPNSLFTMPVLPTLQQ